MATKKRPRKDQSVEPASTPLPEDKIIEVPDRFKPAEMTIRVRPVIKSRKINWEDIHGKEIETDMAVLTFIVEAGKDAIAMWKAHHFHIGPCEGPDWEASLEHWQRQFDYISRYLGEALLKSGLQLCYENDILMYSEFGVRGYDKNNEPIPPRLENMLKTSLDLNLFDRVNAANPNEVPIEEQVGQELQSLRNTFLRLPQFQYLVAWYAYGVRARMNKAALLQVGSNRVLRFNDEMVKRYMDIYPDIHTKWIDACDIIRKNRIHWRDVLSTRMPDLPDDLVTDAGSLRYRPSQLARIDAARTAGIGLNASGFSISRLTIAQEKTIKREIDEYIQTNAGTENEDSVRDT